MRVNVEKFCFKINDEKGSGTRGACWRAAALPSFPTPSHGRAPSSHPLYILFKTFF